MEQVDKAAIERQAAIMAARIYLSEVGRIGERAKRNDLVEMGLKILEEEAKAKEKGGSNTA